MSEVNEGLTNEIEESSELEETEQSVDVVEEDKRSTTKNVSDRINQIRSEAQQETERQIRELSESHQKEIAELNEQILKMRANERGITVDQLKAEEQSEEEKRKEIVRNDPEFQALQQADFNRRISETLDSINKAYPKENLQNLDNLPQDSYKLLQSGVNPVTAYNASVIMNRQETPPSSGSVKTNDAVKDQGGYTRDQVAQMSQKEVEAHWDEITKSMKNW